MAAQETMLLRQQQMMQSSPEPLPYELHQLRSSSADAGGHRDARINSAWTDGDSQAETIYNSPHTRYFDGGYDSSYEALAPDPFSSDPTQVLYPPFPESGEVPSPFQSPVDSGRLTPLSEQSTNANSSRGRSIRSYTKSSSPGYPRYSSRRPSENRVSKAKPRKSKASRKTKALPPGCKPMNAPLSQWLKERKATKDPKSPDLDTKNVEDIVNRPASKRMQEAATRKGGQPARPMNSFMLYRSAYAPVAEAFVGNDAGKNHQVVSRVCGYSWSFETEAVKSYFSDLSKQESANHKVVFPDYRFQPQNKNKDEGEEDKDLLDDNEYRPYVARSSSQRIKAETPYMQQSGFSNPFDNRMHDGQFDFDQGIGVSSGVDMAMLSAPYGGAQHDMFSGYYQGMPAFHSGDYSNVSTSQGFADTVSPHTAMPPYFPTGDMSRDMHAYHDSQPREQLDPTLLEQRTDGGQGYASRYVESAPFYDDEDDFRLLMESNAQ